MVRIKHRYLLVNILSPEHGVLSAVKIRENQCAVPPLVEYLKPLPDSLTPQLFARMIRDQVSLLYGDYGVGLISGSLKINYLSPATATAIIRVARDHYRLVWGALCFVTELPKMSRLDSPRKCVVRVVRVSGTIRKAEEEAIRRARVAILKARGESDVQLESMLGPKTDQSFAAHSDMISEDSYETDMGMSD